MLDLGRVGILFLRHGFNSAKGRRLLYLLHNLEYRLTDVIERLPGQVKPDDPMQMFFLEVGEGTIARSFLSMI